MKKINAVIVVEGKTDVQFLSTFIEAEFVTTNGSDVPRETIVYLQTLSKLKEIIVLTDPDSPGKRIRDILNNYIKGLKHAYVEKKYCIKKHKVGVAEATKEHILQALDNIKSEDSSKFGNLNMRDLFNLGLCGKPNSKEVREKLMVKMNLGFGNAKTLLKRLNSVNCSYQELCEEVKKVNV